MSPLDRIVLLKMVCVVLPFFKSFLLLTPCCSTLVGVRLRDTTVLEGSIIRSNSWISRSIIGWQSSVGKWVRIDNVSVLGEDVHIRDELYINGGSILPHKTISASIAEPKIVM